MGLNLRGGVRFCGVFALLSAGVFLLAWLSGHPDALAFASSRMKTNPALCLVACAGALLTPPKGRASLVTPLLAGAAGVLAMLTLLQYVADVNLGIDEFLARDVARVGTPNASIPNRMAPNTAAAIAALGAGLIGQRQDREVFGRAGRLLLAVALTASSAALVGYVYDATILFRPASLVRMSPYTATVLVFLSVGALLERPDRGLVGRLSGDRTGARWARRLLPATVVLPLVLGWLYLAGQRRALFDAASGTALLVLSIVVVMGTLVVILGRSLDTVDQNRRIVQEDLERASELTAALARTMTVDDVADTVVHFAIPALRAHAGGVLLVENGKLSLASSRGYPKVALGATFDLDDDLPAPHAVRTREAVFLSSAEAWKRQFPRGPTPSKQHRSWAALPLEGRERVLGAIVLSYERPVVFDAAKRARLSRLAWQCAQALDRALLFDSEREALRNTAAAHAALGEAEERLRLSLQAGGAGTFDWHAAGDVLECDPRCLEVLGLPDAPPITLERWQAVVHPDDRERVAATVRAALRGEHDGAMELEYQTTSHRWIHATGQVHLDAAGQARRFVGTVTDVTDARRIQRELNAAGERLRAALAAAAIGTYCWELTDDRVETDDGARAIWAMTEAEGSTLADYVRRVHPEDLPAWSAALEASRTDGADFELRYRIVAPDGSIRWVLDEGRVTRDATGRPQLTRAVVDLTAEHEAREAAESANRAKDAFLAMLGHELRNPLAPILTSLELMRSSGDSAFGRERAIIERQAQHMVRLVDDLLDVSRITRGKVELRKERTELAAVVGGALETVSPLVTERMHRVEVDVPSNLTIDGDPGRLKQVVANLLTNACRYTEPGGKIRIEGRRASETLRLTVSDDGAGIPRELLPHVFDTFVQGRRTIERSQGGLGIGLAIARTLVEMHGGTIEARSEGTGKGTEILVTLPFADAPFVAPPAVASTPAVTSAKTSRVLLVDDNRDACELLAMALTGAGHAVEVAFDGSEALSRADTFRPEVVFLDIGLPEVDGYEVARRLRQTEWGSSVTLIAMTGYGQKSDKEQAVLAGFDRHLVKPVGLDVVLEAARGGGRAALDVQHPPQA